MGMATSASGATAKARNLAAHARIPRRVTLVKVITHRAHIVASVACCPRHPSPLACVWLALLMSWLRCGLIFRGDPICDGSQYFFGQRCLQTCGLRSIVPSGMFTSSLHFYAFA